MPSRKPFPAGMRRRAIKLTAVSSPGQAGPDEASLPAQSRVLDALAESRGVEIIDHIEIPGFSRDFYNWPEFSAAAKLKGIDAGERMQAHWDAKDFDEVLVYDGTRFARKESIFIEFYLRTVDMGAVIVRHLGGEMRDLGAAMFEAFASGQEMRTRKARLQMGREKRFVDGKHHGTLPITHLEVYDQDHKPTGVYILNPAMTAIWQDVYTIVMEGHSWGYIERILHRRYKHVNPKTGKPFIRYFFYRLLTQSPMTWGLLAQHHRSGVQSGDLATVMHWSYDETVPVPAGVIVIRDRCPAVFTGEQAARLKAELRGRQDLEGIGDSTNKYRFSGLCRCDSCRRAMMIKSHYKNRKTRTAKTYYVACNFVISECTNTKQVRFEVVQAYVEALLIDLINTHTWPAAPEEKDTSGERIAALDEEANGIDAELNSLVGDLPHVPAVARDKIYERMHALSDRLEAIKQQKQEIAQQTSKHVRRQGLLEDAVKTLKEITVPGLWTLPEQEINQFLKRLFDGRRIIIREKEIIGIR